MPLPLFLHKTCKTHPGSQCPTRLEKGLLTLTKVKPNAVDILATLRKELCSKHSFATRSLTNHKTRIFLSLCILSYLFPFPLSQQCPHSLLLFSQLFLTMLPVSLLAIGNTAPSQKSLVSNPKTWIRRSFSFLFCPGVQKDPQFLLSSGYGFIIATLYLGHLSKKSWHVAPQIS